MSALSIIGDWPVNAAASAIVDDTGIVESFGNLDEMFALASVTKLLTSYAALVAIEEQTVSLADEAGPPGATVAHLLSHASGVGPSDPRQILAAPGTRRIYSSAGFDLLVEHIADRAAMPFGEFIVEGVTKPLRMASTTFGKSFAHGASSSVRDLANIVVEFLHPTLIDRATFSGATATVFPGLVGVLPGYGRMDPCDWGLGFELRDHKQPHWTAAANSDRTFGHFGQTGTFLWVDPELNAGLVFLCDRPFGDWAHRLWPELGDAVVQEVPARPNIGDMHYYAQGS